MHVDVRKRVDMCENALNTNVGEQHCDPPPSFRSLERFALLVTERSEPFQ